MCKDQRIYVGKKQNPEVKRNSETFIVPASPFYKPNNNDGDKF